MALWHNEETTVREAPRRSARLAVERQARDEREQRMVTVWFTLLVIALVVALVTTHAYLHPLPLPLPAPQ